MTDQFSLHLLHARAAAAARIPRDRTGLRHVIWRGRLSIYVGSVASERAHLLGRQRRRVHGIRSQNIFVLSS